MLQNMSYGFSSDRASSNKTKKKKKRNEIRKKET